MARYFFNIRNGSGFTADDEGMELSSADDARAQAIRGARSLLSAEVLEGKMDLDGQIEVTDSRHSAVLTVHFRDVVRIREGDLASAGGS